MKKIQKMNFNLTDQALILPYQHIKQCSGKQFRSKLIKAFNYWLQIPTEFEGKIEHIIEMLHNASLLIDDIEDNSNIRRGLPAAHLIYGVPSTLNTANYFYFVALNEILQNFPQHLVNKAIEIYTQHMLKLHQGQGMEIFWRDSQICPTIDQLKTMINLKTTSLFLLALNLMKLFSNFNEKINTNNNSNTNNNNSNENKKTSENNSINNNINIIDKLEKIDFIENRRTELINDNFEEKLPNENNVLNKEEFDNDKNLSKDKLINKLCNNLGEFFQIRDDYTNFLNTESFCGDLTEGKYSFPIVHAITNFPNESHLLQTIIKLKTNNDRIKKYALDHLNKLGSLNFTFQVLTTKRREIIQQIQLLGGNQYLEKILMNDLIF